MNPTTLVDPDMKRSAMEWQANQPAKPITAMKASAALQRAERVRKNRERADRVFAKHRSRTGRLLDGLSRSALITRIVALELANYDSHLRETAVRLDLQSALARERFLAQKVSSLQTAIASAARPSDGGPH